MIDQETKKVFMHNTTSGEIIKNLLVKVNLQTLNQHDLLYSKEQTHLIIKEHTFE